jgi:ABC-type spermidine/putrescine transport system permease subunit II
MSKAAKRIVLMSMVVSGAVGVAAAVDLVMGKPFAGSSLMDLMFIASTVIVEYLGWESLREA